MSYGYRGRPQFGFMPRGRPPMMGGPPRGPPRFRGQGFGNMRMQNQWNWSTGADFHSKFFFCTLITQVFYQMIIHQNCLV